MPDPDVSIIVPLLDEEESLPILAGEIAAAMTGDGRPYEVIFVDDGSTDGSPRELARLAAEDPRVRVLRHRVNAGQSAALASGFAAARGAVVVTLDADLQNDPADIPRLLAALAGCDAVSGVRTERHDSWLRRVSSRIANRVRDRVIHDGVTDVGCSLKAYRAELLRRIPLFDGMHRFLPALVQMAGARLVELPVHHRPRRFGSAKYGIRNRLRRSLVDLCGVRWLQKRHLPGGLAAEVTGRRPAAASPQEGPSQLVGR